MHARPGQRIIVQGHTVGAGERRGTVLESRGSATMLVAWDDGQESVLVPGSNVRVEDGGPGGEESRLGCHVDMRIRETTDQCEATATLVTSRGTFQASGVARRHPDDPVVPMIGEELAIGRALEALAAQLLDEASDSIRRHVADPLHLL